MSDLYLVRHGPTHAKALIGWTDLPADLSDTASLARLAARLPPDAALVSSDLTRTRATADALAAALGGTGPRLADRPALREIHFGAWEGLPAADVAERWPELSRAYWDTPGTAAPPEGESWDGFSARAAAAIADLVHKAAGRPLVLVVHFGVILAALQLAAGLPARTAFKFRIDPLSLTHIIRHGPEPGPHDWSVACVNQAP